MSNTSERPADAALAASARTLLSAAAVRDRGQRLLASALDDRVDDWIVDLDRLPPTADFVAAVVRDRYPRLDPPPHARWRHFQFAGRDLWQETVAAKRWPSPAAAARSAFDLVITSVLLDAGAGADWRYHDPATGIVAGRSEGLALASLRWFESGGLSDDPTDKLRVDATVLRRADARGMNQALQVSDTNPLLGAAGRASLLNRLGAAVQARPELFAVADTPRPGGLFDALAARASGNRLPAASLLEALLDAFGPIWQDRPSLGGVSLGDCWPHPALAGDAPADRYAPLHKLSQWLAYSLIEPLEHAGVTVCDVHELTGLAEYRNGGLFVDSGVLLPRDPNAWSTTHTVSDPFVVGWRSITVALLDRIAPLVRERLGLSVDQLPLARVLEGGTWAAGRLVARQRRADGGPPFHISSDGTVF
ncbi:MAG: URC4/urg3 family protein [Pseudomonadota bacterium]|nr:URC4/urg3 family protein [Pseudomonadota bacterium]